MNVTRQFILSFISFLREDWLLRNNVYGSIVGGQEEILTFTGNNTYSSRRENWVYFARSDLSIPNLPPVISDNNGVISSDLYNINYLKGRVVFQNYTPVGNVKAAYSYLYHLVTSSWEIVSESMEAKTPFIVITAVDRSSRPLQIGGGVWALLDVTLQIGEYDSGAYTAYARAEELADIILKGLGKIPIVDYSQAFPLTLSGYLDPDYNLDSQIIGYYTLVDGSQNHYSLPISTKGFARRVVKFSVMVPDEG